MDERMKMVLIIVKKEVSQTFQKISLINLTVAVSTLKFMLPSKFLFPYNITLSRSLSSKDIMALPKMV